MHAIACFHEAVAGSMMKAKRIPLWKIKRELRRLWRKSTGGIWNWSRDYLSWLSYSWFRRPPAPGRTDGDIPYGPRLLIYLIFPDAGVQASHELMLKHFRKAGFSALVVSNLPLSEADRARLRPLCSQIIERENYGYDFGGYREGVLSLESRISSLKELIIANDSIWFPVGPRDDWLEVARGTGAQFVGPVDAFGAGERFELADYRQVRWDWQTSHRRYHMSSFLLWFSSDILRDPGFLAFWRKLRISSDKTLTVRRGEVGLSQFVRAGGYSMASVVDLKSLPATLNAMDAAQLKEVLSQVLVELPQGQEHLLHDQLAQFDESAAWRENAIKMILALSSKRHMAYLSPLLILRYLNGMFLKKALVPKTRQTAETVFALLREYPEYFSDEIAQEIRTTMERTHGA